ncbi:MAG: hypothetical protein QM784_05440 [Polyangiaceae bacterium]
MRTVKFGFAAFFLVCGVAGTAFAQDATAGASSAQGGSLSSDFLQAVVQMASSSLGCVLGTPLRWGRFRTKRIRILSDGISGHIPLWLNLGYMVTPNIMLGLYGQYGFGLLAGDVSDLCDSQDSGLFCLRRASWSTGAVPLQSHGQNQSMAWRRNWL